MNGARLADGGSGAAACGGAGCGGRDGLAWWVPAWPVPGGVRALSTWRSGGVSLGRFAGLNLGGHVGDDPARVAENRRRLRASADLPGEPSWLSQVHGTAVVDLDALDRRAADVDALPVADAAFTRRPGTICTILTADCLPVLIASETGDVVGAAHAGWRGLAAGVLEALVRSLPAPAGSLLAWLGPAIGPRHFEVGPEVRDALLAADPGGEAAFAPSPAGRFLADLPLLARRRLAGCGVWRVSGGGECTYADGQRYYSHRRDGATGRQATLIWIDPAAR